MEFHQPYVQPGWLRAITNPSSSLITYIVSAEGDTMAFLHASASHLLFAPAIIANPDIEEGDLCSLCWPDGTRPLFSLLPTTTHRAYTERRAHYGGRLYDAVVLPGLLLGQRVYDYKSRRATVESVDPLVISLPESESSRHRPADVARFTGGDGSEHDVTIEDVLVEAGERTQLVCAPVAAGQRGLCKNSSLDYGPASSSIVTRILEHFYSRYWPINERGLLDRIYGEPKSFVQPRTLNKPLVGAGLTDGGCLRLDAPQSEAWWLYIDEEACPVFAFEAPPGGGKSLLSIIMALAYCSSSRSDVDDEESDSSALEQDDSSADSSTIEEETPIQILVTPTAGGNRAIVDMLKTMVLKKEHSILNLSTMKQLGSGLPNIIIGTVEDVLDKILDDDSFAHQLQTRCRRVTIDDAHLVSEAELNAIVLCFPHARMALMADPIRNDSHDHNNVAKQLAGASALETVKRKKNTLCIRTNLVYRGSPSAIGPYSSAFYGGRLVSKNDNDDHLLSSIWKRARSDCLMVIVAGSKATPSGRSLINDAEIDAMNHVIGQLRQAGYDHESVMVIALYEAQKRLAMTHLPDGYEVLSVEEARGREQEITIVLTTRDAPVGNYQLDNYTEEDAGFESDQICNVAISRHRGALILLGSKAILDTWWQYSGDFSLHHPWARLGAERGERGFSRITYEREDESSSLPSQHFNDKCSSSEASTSSAPSRSHSFFHPLS